MKKYLFLFSLFLPFFFFSVPRAYAVAGTDPAQVWRCMKGTATDGFHAKVTGSAFPTGKDVYMVACTGGACSTGNASYDQSLKIQGDSNAIQFANGGKTRTNNGNITTTAADTGYFHVGTGFFGVYIQDPPPAVTEGKDKSLQQGTFEFLTLNDPTNCVSVYWDPFGRIFDSQSLEPIKGVSVTILDGNKNKVGRIQNPVVTLADGAFNFLVDEGTYYLVPSVMQGYTFTATPKLNPNYTKGYSDIYKPNDSIPELINTQEERQRGTPDPEHRDIPFDPGANKPFESCPSSISYGAVRLGLYTRIEGKVSHPLTFVSLMQGIKELTRKQADTFGFYQLLVENKFIASNIPLTVSFTKVDLTGANRLFPECNPVQPSPSIAPTTLNNVVERVLSSIIHNLSSNAYAQSSVSIPNPTEEPKQGSITIDPILSYVEGYAYDIKGNIIPNAKVTIRLQMSPNASFYETKADEKGYFQIDPKYIPIFPYFFEFSNPLSAEASTKMTTTEFVKKNKDYLDKNKINLETATKDNKAIPPGSLSSGSTSTTSSVPSTIDSSSFGTSQLGSNPKSTANNQLTPAPKSSAASSLLTILLLLVLILVLGAGAAYLFIRMKKNNGNNGNIPPVV